MHDSVAIDPSAPEDENIETKVWADLAENGLLIGSGDIFDPQRYGDPSSSSQTAPTTHELAYRIAFSGGTVRLSNLL